MDGTGKPAFPPLLGLPLKPGNLEFTQRARAADLPLGIVIYDFLSGDYYSKTKTRKYALILVWAVDARVVDGRWKG